MKYQSIESLSNEKFKTWKSCLESRGIEKHGLFLAFGEKVVNETLKNYPESVSALLTPGSSEKDFGKFTVFSLALPLFAELDLFGTGSPILVCKTPDIFLSDLNESPQGLEVLSPLGDPSNQGALIRSAVAFGATKIILLKEAANPFHPKSVRAASGAILSLKFEKGPSVKDLKPTKNTFCLDMMGEPIENFKFPKDFRFLVGEEGPGIPKNLDIPRLKIQMSEKIDSLNATIAASLAMHAYRSQQH